MVGDYDPATIQALVDVTLRAVQQYSDAWTKYENVVDYPRQQTHSLNKAQTYNIEVGHAELQHSLVRPARASHCFAHSLDALSPAFKVFVFVWNRRHLAKQRHHEYRYVLDDFFYP